MSEPTKAVFLSYASQDAEAAKRIADALRAAGVEVWFDAEGGLEHGDEWDAKIRRQIKECVLFLPIISANTQAREEGYFRIEWELAAQRALGIASGVAFILPVLIDGTREPDALVPDRFRTVQWTKLPGGNVPPEVLQRFLKLWSHRTGALKQAAADREMVEAERPRPAARPPNSRGVLLRAWIMLALVLGVVGYFVFKPRHSPEEVAKIVADAQKLAAAVTPPAPAAPPVSEARQLAARAHALFDALDASRDDYKLAEELIAQAKAKDATDAEVWAAESQLHGLYLARGWDTSNARRESARATNQRALRLDAQSFEARLAQALLLGYTGREGEEKERLLRDLRREHPTDHRVLRALFSTLERQERLDEALPLADEAAALPGGDPLALYNKSLGFWFAGRTAEAENAIQATLAQKPFTGALLMAAWYRTVLHGDTDGARALLDRIAPDQMMEDRAAFFAYVVELFAHRPDAALARLGAVPRDWLNDFWYRGPKGLLIGNAQAMAGRTEAAAGQWAAALKLVNERLAASPNDGNLAFCRVLLLANLGQAEEARRQFTVLVQMAGVDPAGEKPVLSWVTECCALLGRKADAIRQISVGLKQRRRAVDYTAASLRLDPRWDALRGEPGFAALLAEAERIEQTAANAATPSSPAAPRDWPKNPELKRATNLLDGLETIPEDLRLAEEITQRVLDKNPTDPEAVTAMARVHSMWLLRGWDRSTARYQKAKATAERAIQLAPDEPEAYVALAIQLYARGAEPQRALDLAQRAVDLDPSESRFHRMRDNCLWVANVAAGSVFSEVTLENENEGLRKALAAARHTVELFPRDPLVRYELSRHYRDIGRWADFEKVNDEVLAIAPVANALVWKARARFGLHGDLPGMKAVLDQVPARVRGIERTVYAYFLYAAFTGHTTDGLEALNTMTESWMIDFDYRGPKALLTAALLELGGKKELARLQYTAALDELMRARGLNAEDAQTYINEAWIKHALGRTDEARAALRIFNEALTRPYVIGPMNTWWFQAIPANLLMGERATALALMREAVTGVLPGREAIRSRLALDPRMAPFRDDPEIQAILAEPAAAGSDSSAKATEDGSGKASPPDQKSVAVLAFANLSDDKANEYFSDGISEELLNVLAKVPKLKVAARTSSFYFKGKEVPVPEIARQLGVAYVVEGSVRKAGNKVRITAQLIKAADGFHVWSETYDRDLTDIFAVQDEIAKNILGVVKGSLLGEAELPHTTTTKIEAYTLFLQAQGAFAKRGEANLREAVRLYKAALAIDPDYVPALVGLAQASVVLPNYAFVSGATAREITDGAMQAARHALQLDPQNAAAQAVIGWATFQFDWRWEEGLAGMLRARDLAPNDSWTWNCLGDCHRFAGDLVQALKDKQRAWELDPLSPNSHWDLSYTYLVAGRYAEAIHWSDLAIAMAPRNLDSYMPGVLAAGRAARFDDMHRMLALARQNMQEAEGMLRLIEAICAILEHNPGEARRLLALALPQVEAGTASPAALGYCYLLLGDTEPAALWLQRGLERSDEALIWNEVIDFEVVAANPKTRPILDQPRLKELREIRQRNARAGLNKL